MTNELEMLEELEDQFMKDINHKIMDILSIKFSNQISKIIKFKISDMIQYHLNETIWLDQMKENLNHFITEYTHSLNIEKNTLNKRMDSIEQTLLNFIQCLENGGIQTNRLTKMEIE